MALELRTYFEPNKQYRNRNGWYIVQRIEADRMLVTYETGEERWLHDLERQERIVKGFAQELQSSAEIEAVLIQAKATRTGQYSVYVILCRSTARQSKLVTHVGSPAMPCVYVGQTGKAIDERFIDHLIGRNSRIQPFALALMPELYEVYNPISTRGQALQVEAALAKKLHQDGFTVLGGH